MVKKRTVILGTLLAFFGICLYLINAPKIPSIILAVLGLLLIIFNNKIEEFERKSKKKKK